MDLRIGAIGIGGLGYLQAKTYAELSNVEIVCAADVSPDARELFSEEFHAPAYEQVRSMLFEHAEDLDAVSIATPHTLHHEQAMLALEHDLHVLVEKPMVTDVGHAVDLVGTADAHDLVLQVGYQRHFHPAFKELRRVIESQRIGELHSVNCHLGQNWIDSHQGTWRVDPSLSGGGQLYDSGSHLLDALLWTTGATPTTVAAQIEFDSPRIDVNSALALKLERDGRTITTSVGVSGDGVDILPSEGYHYWGNRGRLSYVDDRITVAERGAVTYRTELTGEGNFQALNQEKLQNFIASIDGTEEPARAQPSMSVHSPENIPCGGIGDGVVFRAAIHCPEDRIGELAFGHAETLPKEHILANALTKPAHRILV